MSLALKTGLAAALTLGALGLSAASASAMPLGLDAAAASSATHAQIDNVRWVCGPYRCHWVPNYWGGPRWGWRHHHHWRHW